MNTVAGVGKLRMDRVVVGVLPFLLAQFLFMFVLVAFPQLVIAPARLLN